MSEVIFPQWFNIPEAKQFLSISEPTLYRWMKGGRLTFYKVGDSTRFKKEDLERMIEKHVGETEAQSLQESCQLCGGRQIEPGSLASTGKVYFKAGHTRFFSLATSEVELKAKICMDCGHVQLFADMSKVRKLTGKKISEPGENS